MLKVTAEGVRYRLHKKAGYRYGKQQHHESRTARQQIRVLWRFKLPADSKSLYKPPCKGGATPVDKEQSSAHTHDQLENVLQNVVSAFVPEHEKHLVVRQTVSCGIPHYIALGGPYASHVGIDSVIFLTCLHQEHAAWRNIDACPRHNLFQLGHQCCVM